MNSQSVEQLRGEFLKEAKTAPKLFRDLAKVEQYIAESYKTRALIELIQNADDAGASLFGIHDISNGFIIGNNGREFSINDLESLCRSGSSNKQRGGSTIGYRGIGFKSVVNIANKVSIDSGDYRFTFNRQKTQKVLEFDLEVPLIRIPHPIDISDEVYRDVTAIKKKYNYTTVFIFQDVIEEISKEELSSIDRSSLLFLKNLRQLSILHKNVNRKIRVEHKTVGLRRIISINEAEFKDKWEVNSLGLNEIDLIAFKKEGDSIIPASPVESVIHSFTPTKEFSGAFIKINGDYSTDPSRKSIDFDEQSKNSFKKAVSIIAKSIISILGGDLTREGFFTPFVNINVIESSQFKLLLFKELQEILYTSKVPSDQGNRVEFSSYRIKPDWLNFEDYENLSWNDLVPIKKSLITTYPELFTFLKSIGVKTLNLEEVLYRLNDSIFSNLGYAQIFEKIIKQYRYDLDSDKIEQLMKLKLFPLNDEIVTARKITDANTLKKEFKEYLNNNVDQADLNLFYRKLEIIPEIQQTKSNSETALTLNNETEEALTTNQLNSNFKTEPAIKKWRSAEKNVQEYLKSLNISLSVKDVTEANLGYDLELMLQNGKRIYIEVKSVNSFIEPFKISNNEYSSAHNYGEQYYIALVVNNEDFQIKFVPNPIQTLSFEKKCERWSWFCGTYYDELKEINQIIF
ncbi:hypothetical protein MTsPCn9_11260 [Croceitalea sp. MTPC9]|uniref:DUF3883 domain-containing protein n=1 Tax=unclassified Croceitalea TaxID=2632280 RepID=UPI002B3D5D40|nr:hypothetical protein MTsPCn6_25980 [Croceitalea sp. MTPC6]GMN16190.1 hypothetical protein MTsPCn9_11260 [Croceitalea sp. MTPC9]